MGAGERLKAARERLPVMKITDAAAPRMRDAMIKAGTIPSDTSGDVGEFFVGRNPA